VRRYTRCEEVEVKGASDLERAVPAEATLVVLEPDGEQVSSKKLAARLEGWVGRARSPSRNNSPEP
jgi:23S rRNA pseudoU1915 N3-methylase RlmH